MGVSCFGLHGTGLIKRLRVFCVGTEGSRCAGHRDASPSRRAAAHAGGRHAVFGAKGVHTECGRDRGPCSVDLVLDFPGLQCLEALLFLLPAEELLKLLEPMCVDGGLAHVA